MKVKLVLWGLAVFQSAAQSLISGFEKMELVLDEKIQKNLEKHSSQTQKIAEKAMLKQVIVDRKRDSALHAVEKKRQASRTQLSTIKSKLSQE